MEKLLNCIYNPQAMVNFDKNIKNARRIEVYNKKSYGFLYFQNKKVFQVQSRDFVEKYVGFYHKGKYYRIVFSYKDADKRGPNGEPPFCPVPDKQTVRGETVVGAITAERTADGKIKLTTVIQCDLKISIPTFMITTFLPRATKEWYENLNQYYDQNQSNL